MANIPLNPEGEFNTEMERLETTTPAHANAFNTRYKQLLENDEVLNKRKINASEKGIKDGVASLGNDGSVPDSQLPKASVKDLGIVQLNSSTASASEATAATSKAVNDIKNMVDLKANLASPGLTGTPTAPTAATTTNNTQIATTAFVQANMALKANLASPALTGTPTAPTAATATNNTQIATTAYVKNNLTAKANLASPSLTGTPTAPTAAATVNTTQIATTAYVTRAIGNISFARASCKAVMSANRSGGSIYLQCDTLSLNLGSYFEKATIDTWGVALKAKKNVYALIHANFIYSSAAAGRKKVGICKVYTTGAYTELGFSYTDTTQSLTGACCTAFGYIEEGACIVAYAQGASSDTATKDGTYLIVNEL